MAKAKRPDITTIKNRIKNKEPEPPASDPPPKEPVIRKETHDQVKQYAQEVAAQAKAEQERVDLGPLPEHVEVETEDSVYYRNTAYDNLKVRTAVEGRCTEIDFADLVITGRVVQEVAVLPDKLAVTYQSLLASDNIWIERKASRMDLTDWAMRSWMGYARLAMSVVSVNGKDLPPHVDKEGDATDAGFEGKFKELMRNAEKVVELMLINLTWFDDRVTKLCSNDFELLKNG